MKFAASIVAFALAATSTVTAGTFISPTEGQVLSSGSNFNLTFDGGRYFKESSNSISVLLAFSSTWSGSSGSQGVTLIEDIQPTGQSSSTTQVFYSDVKPKFFYQSTPAERSGNWTVVVVENYNSYGGGNGTALWTQTVTFSD